MPPIIIPDAFQITLQGVRAGQEVVNVFGYRRVGGINGAECLNAGISWRNNVLPSLLACLSSTYAGVSITVRNLTTAGGPEAVIPLIGPYTGTRGANAAPGNVAIVSSWYTANAVRAGRGRNYLSPLSESDLFSDFINTALVALIGAFANALINNLPIIGSNFAVITRKFHFANPVNGFRIDTTLDSQRRRLTGRGR